MTMVQVSSFDPDDGCGQNCNPQTCDFNQNPPVCSPAPDPGFTASLFAPSGRGWFTTSVSTGNPNEFETEYACDSLYPGPVEICALVSDGDNDCNQVRCTTVVCPDLCEHVVCPDDGDECTREWCNPFDGQCQTQIAPDGIACADCSATCVSGTCSGPDWVGAQNGAGGNIISFVGTRQVVNDTLLNPYSGESLQLSGSFNVNTSSYEGLTAYDVIVGSNAGDLLVLQEPIGSQRVCGVEAINTLNSFDAVIMADASIVYGDLVIRGGRANDVLWSNSGNDTIEGEAGNDLLDGGPGNDAINGGLGDDTITLWPGSGSDSISVARPRSNRHRRVSKPNRDYKRRGCRVRVRHLLPRPADGPGARGRAARHDRFVSGPHCVQWQPR